MADRYDIDRDRDRGGRWERDRERGGDRERGEWNREFGSRDREADRRYQDWNRHFSANEGRYGEERHEDYDRQRHGSDEGWRENRPVTERSDFSTRGDWGRQGAWGNFGNRADYHRENDWRENRGNDWGAERSDFGGQRTSRTNLYGTGGGGFGSGFSSYGAGMGPYGAGALGGGMGAYGERERGRYSGRGPKGWQRSDERIREDINERLTDHPHVDASEIEVQVQNGLVTLNGTVDERHAKRLAEDIVESVSGVRDVHNQIRVQNGGDHRNDQGQQPATPGVMESRGPSSTGGRTK
jgi:hypothetical protein